MWLSHDYESHIFTYTHETKTPQTVTFTTRISARFGHGREEAGAKKEQSVDEIRLNSTSHHITTRGFCSTSETAGCPKLVKVCKVMHTLVSSLWKRNVIAVVRTAET